MFGEGLKAPSSAVVSHLASSTRIDEVEPEDNEFKKLLNCNHGVQFHRGCIESWLKDHSTCPLCRSHVQRPVHQRLNAYMFKLRDNIVLYCNIALENVASSINGDCQDC
ncbi:zinc finger, RING/FYVE/PHD-type [Artemisia annua]|uniref:RING-type E3 ubiquitin transferase n=1 Tax=Artemisia annua TaxID=35608 RepID=A0A2U1MA10_ARTAN|nr:zinc finger, RING/FYVE/PHD-type [Artemisia annua]